MQELFLDNDPWPKINPWIDYQSIDFNEPELTGVSIDTRDFHALRGYDQLKPEDVNIHKARKEPEKYYHTPEEIKKLIDRYYKESGGEGEWRHFSLTGEAAFRTEGWQLKYIRVYKLDKGWIVYHREENFLFSKKMLACEVNQQTLNFTKD